jgi:uncharacterized repeat protein (TIGR03803 family)
MEKSELNFSNVDTQTRFRIRTMSTFIVTFVFLIFASTVVAQTETVLHNFIRASGSDPFGPLIFDRQGNLYGETVEGGKSGGGVVFKIANGSQGWVYRGLYQFTGRSDGSEPVGGLTFDGRDDLYGTAQTVG